MGQQKQENSVNRRYRQAKKADPVNSPSSPRPSLPMSVSQGNTTGSLRCLQWNISSKSKKVKLKSNATINNDDDNSISSSRDNISNDKPMPLSLFDRMGGVLAVRAVIEEFYRRILDDERLAFFFLGAHMANLKLHQLKLFKIALTEIPKDLDVAALILEKHMRLFVEKGLNEKHFDLFAGHLVDTLHHFKVSEDLICEAVGVVAPLRPIFEQGAEDYGRSPQVALSLASATNVDETSGDDDVDRASHSRPQSHDSAGTLGSTSSTMTLTDKLGGPAALKAVVDDLYYRLTSDKTLKVFFRNVDVATLKLHQLYFLQHVTDGKVTDQERLSIVVRQSHQRLFREMGLNGRHFDRLVEHLIITLKKFGVRRDVMHELLEVLGPLREAFVLGNFLSERIFV